MPPVKTVPQTSGLTPPTETCEILVDDGVLPEDLPPHAENQAIWVVKSGAYQHVEGVSGRDPVTAGDDRSHRRASADPLKAVNDEAVEVLFATPLDGLLDVGPGGSPDPAKTECNASGDKSVATHRCRMKRPTQEGAIRWQALR